MTKKVKNTVLWTYVINIEEIVVTFHEKKLQKKPNQRQFRIENAIKTKDKLYVKWKGHDNSFNN